MNRNAFSRKVVRQTVLAGLFAATSLAYDSAPAGGFRVPKDPPGADYVLEAKLAVGGETATVDGRGTIGLTNTNSLPLSIVAIEWTGGQDQIAGLVTLDGRALRCLNAAMNLPPATPLFFELPRPLERGAKIKLSVRFTYKTSIRAGQIDLQAWYPRLWWEGIPVRDEFKVKLEAPAGWVTAASGRLDPKTGYYENGSVTTRFGFFLSNAMKSERRESEGIELTALFTDKGKACALHCLEAAADIIRFYKGWLGVYPHRSLCIIPGQPKPVGGYPYASGIVVIHGEEAYNPQQTGKSPNWWTWITAHEIGHQFWGEFVMPGDVRGDFTDSWLMIGLGICADKEYMLKRGFGWKEHQDFLDRYLQGVRERNDTTMDAPPSLARTQKFDVNNVIIHGKGFAVMSALETLLGNKTFDRIYRATIASCAGKRLAWREFRTICENETGEDLGWFFEDWVRSNKFLECRITSETSEPKPEGGFASAVGIEYGTDSLRMPVPLEAVFEDGARELRWTDRFAAKDIVRFESRAKLKETRLDPEHRLAVVEKSLPKTAADLEDALDALDWTGTGEAALDIYRQPQTAEIKAPHVWFKMGLLLYDGRHYSESFEAFKKSAGFGTSEGDRFGGFVWMGITKDVLGERDKAIEFYREALKHDSGRTMQHDQYRLRINKAWVEERLKTPFKRD